MRRSCVPLVALFALAGCAQPETTDPAGTNAITPEAVRAHVEFLADDLLEGRGTGSRGHLIAARYVAGVFRGAGLEPGDADGTYMAPVRLRSAVVDAARSSAAILRDGRIEPLAVFEDFIPAAPAGSEAVSVEAPAAFVGWGIAAPALGHDDYQGVETDGRIAVMLFGAPPSFEGDAAGYYTSPAVKRQIAAEHGAVGMVVVPSEAFLALAPWDVIARINRQPQLRVLTASDEPLGATTVRTGGMVSPDAATQLFASAPSTWDEVRRADAPGSPQRFDLGIGLRLTVAGRHEDLVSPNVIGILRGSDPALRDEYVVVTAHLDHEGIGVPVDGDSIYNGALDNAAGVAALLEAARALRTPARCAARWCSSRPRPKRRACSVPRRSSESRRSRSVQSWPT